MFYHHTEQTEREMEVHCHEEGTHSTPRDAREVSQGMEYSLYIRVGTVATNHHNTLIPSSQFEESMEGNCNTHSMP